jgi:hypothetical protein
LDNKEIEEYFPDFENCLNANILDYLLENQELIPESWKNIIVFFLGTQYYDPLGNICVRYLCWFGEGGWGWSCRSISGSTIGSFLKVGSVATYESL